MHGSSDTEDSSGHLKRSVAVIGTVGIPASYGGFETLAENLVRLHPASEKGLRFSVYCSSASYAQRPREFLGARLHYVPLKANGPASVLYDLVCMFLAVFRQADSLLVLGVSGAVGIPIVRACSTARIVTNIDGLEWKRAKWGKIARWWLKFSEKCAVNSSHEVITDNQAIADYVRAEYGRDSRVIAYGGDHAVETAPSKSPAPLPGKYALSVCRIEPENNVALILEAFSTRSALPLVFVGNWAHSLYGRKLHEQYQNHPSIHLLDPIYDAGTLRSIRQGASLYVHGHSAGGTNPSLVEIMHFGIGVLAFDCTFNRYTTEDKARFFSDVEQLRSLVETLSDADTSAIGTQMKSIALRRYTWSVVARDYYDLLG